MRRIVVFLAVLVVVLSGLIAFRLWTQARALSAPSGGSGEIEGTIVELSSRVGARIVEVKVKEGQAVKAGDLLLRLDCADPEAQVAEAEARAAAARRHGACEEDGRDPRALARRGIQRGEIDCAGSSCSWRCWWSC